MLIKDEIKAILEGWFGGSDDNDEDMNLIIEELYELFKRWEGRK